MNTFPLKISSPEGDIFCGEAVSFRARGTEGELAVLAGHIPFVSYIKPCECKITLAGGDEKLAQTGGGILTVSQEKVIFLSGDFVWKE
ncbi:MAG: hypothetical protein IKT50_03165 [Clostridia bacterium]|nr:hypothetical protein [Clostridia bacterium]